MSEKGLTPRRGNRQRKLSLKALESVAVTPTKKNLLTAEDKHEDENEENEHSDSSEELIEKPTIIHTNEAVVGSKIFAFQKRKNREALLQKASQVQQPFPKTPHAQRNKLKKDIVAKILEDNDSSDQDFSQSEFEESSSQDSEDSEPEAPKASKGRAKLAVVAKNVNSKRINGNYTIKTEDYFSQHSSKKILTSNHTLDKLETPRLPQDQLQKLLSKMELAEAHKNSFKQLADSNRSYFNKWLYLMHENFNILVYGLGSKMNVLNTFHEECLKKLPVIVINGFFPSLTIKDVLDGIIGELLELKEIPGNIYEACEVIEKEFSYIPETHLYIIVFNIDMMRSGKAQNVFARLAAVKNIHLIASIDHINAPLIWDHSKLSKFNFTWWDATSFHPYTNETSFESSMMVQKSGTLALSSLRNVFLSLTSNSKGIYFIIVKYQLEHGKNQYYQGLSFKDLYSSCREAFLASSDLALRAQLTEFVDHKMVKFKRSPDGTEYLIIPISNQLLQQFLTEHTS